MNTQRHVYFKLGRILSTPGAIEAFKRNNTSGLEYLKRHISGDWGVVCDEDKQANDQSLETGARILSAYLLPDETKLWLITDATVDEHGTRPATTFLLPEEY